MEDSRQPVIRRWTDHLFGGIDMKWWKVIVFAVAAAALTAIFLIIPVFKDTSFRKMGETFEAWILFAVIIMANCRSPLDSALKTFVFFLISQPLIYLLQVPFSWQGWALFGYYKYWFFWTLLTFPMAYVGWYIRKKNWLSLLIFLPVILYLTLVYVSSFSFAFRHFPRSLVAALFCLGQVLLYLYVFVPKLWQKILGFLAPLAVILLLTLLQPKASFGFNDFLPDDPILSEAAVAVSENTDFAVIAVASTGRDSMIHVNAKGYGRTDFTIRDGDKEYLYSLEIYEDENGHTQTRITRKEG